MKFTFKANCEFEANDINHACDLLKDHFNSIILDAESPLQFTGHMDINPSLEEDTSTCGGDCSHDCCNNN